MVVPQREQDRPVWLAGHGLIVDHHGHTCWHFKRIRTDKNQRLGEQTLRLRMLLGSERLDFMRKGGAQRTHRLGVVAQLKGGHPNATKCAGVWVDLRCATKECAGFLPMRLAGFTEGPIDQGSVRGWLSYLLCGCACCEGKMQNQTSDHVCALHSTPKPNTTQLYLGSRSEIVRVKHT